ncbi:melanocyte-stimulating hormone receptor-like [Pocillopora verrucosa]|uniref:melanocyte-stimulating hormone receptor-like n=1 Tax=Pocillopora verrucosa TaxID=203993 RepID=UPI00279790BD|nr:melanocyte-stimulating hormone receptor-like [Pocillopora verrucosa]
MSDPRSSKEDNFFISQAILSIVFATSALLSNVFLMITVCRNTNLNQRIWQTHATYFVVNLSICDLLAGLVPGYGGLFYNISILRGQTRESLVGLQSLIVAAAVMTNIVSSCTIVLMSYDRWLAVSSPLHYKARVTKAKIKAAIASTWIYSLIFSSLPFLGVALSLFSLLYCHLHVSVPLIILPVLYWKTLRALRHHNNQVQDVADDNGRRQIDEAHRNRERKMVSAFLLILVFFYLSFGPQFIAQNVLVFCPDAINQESFSFFLYASNKFLLVNCCLNPFIYAWRIPTYRRAFREIFSDCVRLPRNSVSQ